MTTAVWQAEALYCTLLNMCDVICGHNALGCCEDCLGQTLIEDNEGHGGDLVVVWARVTRTNDLLLSSKLRSVQD